MRYESVICSLRLVELILAVRAEFSFLVQPEHYVTAIVLGSNKHCLTPAKLIEQLEWGSP
jgi:acyl carrier protein